MRSCPRGFRRSVDRGAHRPAIEPRKIPILGADTVQIVEGNTSGRVIASARTTRRGQRPCKSGNGTGRSVAECTQSRNPVFKGLSEYLCVAMSLLAWPESKKAAKILLLLKPAERPFDYYSQSYSLLTALGDGRDKSCAARRPQLRNLGFVLHSSILCDRVRQTRAFFRRSVL
jgi:hypothetical protein